MNRKPKIGIIGGAGPIAGSLLFQRIIEISQKNYGCLHDKDFPFILMFSYPFANMFSSRYYSKTSKQLKWVIEQLIKNQVDIVVIACNTLHAFLEKNTLQKYNLLHLLKETKNYLQEKQISNPLVLATNTSVSLSLHHRYFPCGYPQIDLQLFTHKLIEKILSGNITANDAQELTQRIQQLLITDYPERTHAIVLGCTELSVLHRKYPLMLGTDIEVIDPNEIIANKICQLVF